MLKAPRIKAFTSEKNTNEFHNVQTINVSYAGVESEPKAEVTREITRDVVLEQNTKTEKILKMMLEAYKNNPLHINDYIVLTDKTLADLVRELTDALEVQLQISADIKCCGNAARTQYLDGIVVKKNDKITDFKIGFNEEYNFLNDYRISTDFIITPNDSAA